MKEGRRRRCRVHARHDMDQSSVQPHTCGSRDSPWQRKMTEKRGRLAWEACHQCNQPKRPAAGHRSRLSGRNLLQNSSGRRSRDTKELRNSSGKLALRGSSCNSEMHVAFLARSSRTYIRVQLACPRRTSATDNCQQRRPPTATSRPRQNDRISRDQSNFLKKNIREDVP